jgi:hypothetical protein
MTAAVTRHVFGSSHPEASSKCRPGSDQSLKACILCRIHRNAPRQSSFFVCLANQRNILPTARCVLFFYNGTQNSVQGAGCIADLFLHAGDPGQLPVGLCTAFSICQSLEGCHRAYHQVWKSQMHCALTRCRRHVIGFLSLFRCSSSSPHTFFGI